jgi:DNA repair protein RadA/Sms
VAKARTQWVCQGCGATEPRWVGKCSGCAEFGSMLEEALATATPAGAIGGVGERAVPIAEAVVREGERLSCGIGELDRVLGGGLVLGSLVLLGGEPGIGKSTLLLMAAGQLAARCGKRPVLYASGEESVAQTGLRAQRLGVRAPGLLVLAETALEKLLSEAARVKPAVIIVDSIQTLHTTALESIPGSVGQVRECAGRLMTYAKTQNVPVVLVGHVTKDGSIAGPKTLEHVVDAVLYFEGEGSHAYRVLRAVKNRFGSTNELGVFEMRSGGLAEVPNPSASLLAERPVNAPGSVVVASLTGTRPLLVELQALVAGETQGFGRRTTLGVDSNRVALLLAILERRVGIDVRSRDVFTNVAGGLKLAEPAIDLALCAALASSARGRAIDEHTVVFGEVGLAGEVRAVGGVEARLAEAGSLGFSRAVLPEASLARLESDPGLELVGVRDVPAALAALGLAAPDRR